MGRRPRRHEHYFTERWINPTPGDPGPGYSVFRCECGEIGYDVGPTAMGRFVARVRRHFTGIPRTPLDR